MLKGTIDKKASSQGFKDKLINERLERKKQRVEKKKLQLHENKLAKEKKDEKPPTDGASASEQAPAAPMQEQQKIHFKKNMLKKTRSKQKGKKKDNRPIDVKREKLALKGITI